MNNAMTHHESAGQNSVFPTCISNPNSFKSQKPNIPYGQRTKPHSLPLGACDKIVGFTAAVWVGPAAIKTFVVVTLRFVGFSAHGPVAGSWAAAWMSNVARMDAHTSIGAAIFAWAQSVSMTWPLITTSAAVLGVISGVYVAVRCAVGNFEGTVLSSGVFGGHDAVGDRERLARIDEDIEANRGEDTDELIALGDAGNVDTAESPCADDVRAPLLVLS